MRSARTLRQPPGRRRTGRAAVSRVPRQRGLAMRSQKYRRAAIAKQSTLEALPVTVGSARAAFRHSDGVFCGGDV